MTPPTTDPRVHAYLDAVRRSLSGTDPKHAETIVADLESHILDAVGDDVAAGRTVDIGAILRSLGEPETIAAAATPALPIAAQAPLPFLDTRGGSVVTIIAVALGGAIIPVLGWIAAVILLWNSRWWRTRDKLLVTLAPPLTLAVTLGVAFLFTTATQPTADCGPGCAVNPLLPAPFDIVWSVVFLAGVIIPALCAIWLLITRRDPAALR